MGSVVIRAEYDETEGDAPDVVPALMALGYYDIDMEESP